DLDEVRPAPRRVEGRLATKPLLPPPTQLRDAAAAPDEPTAAAPASPSTEETMSQQLGARGNDRDQHQLLECLRCNYENKRSRDRCDGRPHIQAHIGHHMR